MGQDFPSELGGTMADWNPEQSTLDSGPLMDSTLPGEDEIPFDPAEAVDTGTRGFDGDSAVDPGSRGTSLSQVLPALLDQYNQYGYPRPPGFGGRNPPNLGIAPMPPGSPGYPGGRAMNAARAQASARRGAILAAIAARLGRRVALHAVAALVGKWGLPATSAALGVGAEDLLFLIAQYASSKGHRGRRGPHLHTVVKRIKSGDRYRHMLQKWAHKAGVHGHRAAAPSPFHHRRHKRRK